MGLSVSKRTRFLSQSEIRNMSIECDKIGGVNLSQGICDLECPDPVKKGAHFAIDSGINHYTRYDGLEELRKAIAVKEWKYNRIKADPEKNIIASAGATGAFYCACLALLNPGDEVIIFEPFYGYHVNTLLAADAVPKYVKTEPPNWNIDFHRLEKVVTKKTKGIMINTPANPSGKVFTQAELMKITDFCESFDLFIFTDEIYEYFIYDGYKHISPASIEKNWHRTITISGHSKTFSITGWRVGYCICDEKWAKMIGYINDLIYVCAPSPLQIGVACGINELSDEFYQSVKRQYQAKRDKICSILEEVELNPNIPAGAYYVLANAKRLVGKTSKEKAMYLLTKTNVASVPGSSFYHDKSGENLLRFCFAKDDDILDMACKNLKNLL